MNEKATPNIYDIATAAGVSIATVSRVLSGGANVRPSTLRKVTAVIEAKRYTPNAFARGLGLGSMKMVGILCTDVADLYYARAVSILERLLRQNGLDTLLYCTGPVREEKKRFMGYLLAKNVDAILLVGSAFKELEDNSHIEEAAKKSPVIIINGLVECENTYCVLCDEKNAMRENVRLLKEKGCRDILYLYHAPTFSSAQKFTGFREGLEENGLGERRELIRHCERSPDAVRSVVCDMIDAGIRFDAVVTTEDMLAAGAGKALADRHLKLPVIGFDNSILASCATPSLTSVDNMVESLCSRAVDILGEVLSGGKPEQKTVIPARLVERESFKPA